MRLSRDAWSLGASQRGGKGVALVNYLALLKYGVVTLCSGLWGYGLIEQIDSLASTAKYIVISLLMVAISLL